MPNPPVDVDSWGGSACYPRSTFYPLSDGHSTLSRRITRAYFRICSTCRSRSQARLYSCTLRTIANRSERTLRAPPLHFRRRPPQSNYPPHAVPAPDNGSGLEAQNSQGGIPRLTPRELTPPLQSLPPILGSEHQTSTQNCSKGSRGLSVQPRVLGIFTETTISPDPSLRQRPSRYAIRAGRNLPDKEFRYLRTVIVTAAVYWGLDSKLRPKANLSS